MRSYTQSILSWGPGFQHDEENYRCQCPVLLDYICQHMPVRVTENEGWRVTQIYGERGRVGSRREVNMIFHCPVFADYRPMKHACLFKYFEMRYFFLEHDQSSQDDWQWATNVHHQIERWWLGRFTLPFSTLRNGAQVYQRCVTISG